MKKLLSSENVLLFVSPEPRASALKLDANNLDLQHNFLTCVDAKFGLISQGTKMRIHLPWVAVVQMFI